MANWLQKNKLPFGWYSLDINDNDTSVFVNHLISALHLASNEGCPQSLALVQQQEHADLHNLMAKAMMEVAQVDQHFFLVLDDLQEISNKEIISVIRHWLKLLPNQLHVILCCQHELPVSLSSFRVRGQLLEIGATQLAFNLDETKEFLLNNLDFPLSQEAHNELFQRTGGWPAALQLVTLGVRTQEQLLHAASRIGQSMNDVKEYVVFEVFEQQPERIKIFLLDICIFKKFTASLCDTFLDHRQSDDLIAELEHRQLFISHVEGEIRWYQFQAVFRGAVLTKLEQEYPERAVSNRFKAIDAYLDCGMNIEAIQLALTLKSEPHLLMVLKRVGFGLYKNGQFNTLTKLFSSVVRIKSSDEPTLALLKSWLLLATYREDEVKFLLPNQNIQAEDHPSSDDLWAEQAVAQAQASVNSEDFERGFTLAKKAISHLKPESYISRTAAYSVLGQSALCRGDLDKAKQMLNEAEKLAFNHRLFQQRLWSMCLMSDVLTAQGELSQALQTQKNTMEMARDACIDNLLHMEFLYRSRARLLIEQGDLKQAERLLQMSEKIMEPLGDYGLLNVHVLRGFIALWRGQYNIVRGLAFQVNYQMQQHKFHTDWLAYGYEFLLACEQLDVLDFKPVYGWQERVLAKEPNNHFYQHYQRVYAIVQYLSGDKSAAINRLTRLVVQADKKGLKFQWFKAKLLLAIWQNDSVGEQHWLGILDMMADFKPMQSLWLSQSFCLLDSKEGSRSWLDWHVWFGTASQKERETLSKGDELLQTLNEQYANPEDLVTAKECQVLLFIGEGLTNDEISASMHIAISTVKSHIRRLYRKLDISHRSQAIQICKHL
ncbi:LuxR C-terminal-related transcriptional regulator [Reinekea sp.]|uniref:LuxR C-terminal-related transcriptional regulator n=1 Tax=Reinekea sp. TaxID=1970455 RepID=UPI0039899D0B